mmetsp:Transcript_115887/g.368468  ORF Transcript_115887/g.368468 Transcript_115887/m.368468 type:complete len:655 (-) Transcript_115887:3-1967(-)
MAENPHGEPSNDMAGVVDVTADSGSDVAEIVDVSDAESGGVAEVSTGAPPLWFKGYRRGQELGRGSSGKVFMCSRKSCAGGFAVKIIDLRRIEMSPYAEREQKKLRREIDILKKLPPHKNVVQLVDAFEEGHWMFFVLELVGGGDLFTVLTSRSTPRLLDREAAFVLLQLARGLQFLHGEGVIHRDLKLENVLVASERYQRPAGVVLYNVKITDFGLSKSVGDGFSVAKSTVGTRPYTAPEIMKEGVHDFKADLWCLGVLLFVMLAGHFPFDHIAAKQEELDAIVNKIRVTDVAKAVLQGFLRLDSSSRVGLAEVLEGVWLSEEAFGGSLERPVKRLRSAASPGASSSGTSAPAEAATTALPAQARAVAGPCGSSAASAAGAVSASLGEGAPSLPPASGPALVSLTAAASLHGEAEVSGLRIPKGAWTPFAVEATVRISDVNPASPQPEVMQVHIVILERLAGLVLGRGGSRIQQTAVAAGCPVWMTPRDGSTERRIVVFGNYKQCKLAQELVHEQIATAQDADWRDLETEVYLLVRGEAAGVVTGKQGFVLDRIRKHSGARIQLLRQELEGQRPCMIAGNLQSVLRAQRLVFHLVSCVPVTHSSSDRQAPVAASSGAAGAASCPGAAAGAGAAGDALEERPVVAAERGATGTV